MSPRWRTAREDEAILGVRPEFVCEPETLEEAREAVRESAGAARRLAFVGGGTDLELGPPPERLDAIIRTSRLTRVVEHTPADQIAVVEAGVTLAVLQAALRPHGQRLALDPPQPERATLGGIIASNAFGPRRARFGSVRDLLIGISIVRADGTLARGGGKVVKNVAGFDLPRLMVGSLGTLGLIATATLRLHPLPQQEATLLLPGLDGARVRALVTAIRDAQLEPTSVAALRRSDGRFDVAVRFEGFRAGVDEQRDRMTRLVIGDAQARCDLLDDAGARDFWKRHEGVRTVPPLRLRLSALPSQIDAIATQVLPGLEAALDERGFVWYATLGIGFFSGAPRDPVSAAEAIAAARSALQILGGRLTLQAAPPSIRGRVEFWGAAPSALPLMRELKQRLDPERRLAPGRFVGGI